jgi:hypothetical protein
MMKMLTDGEKKQIQDLGCGMNTPDLSISFSGIFSTLDPGSWLEKIGLGILDP